MNTDVQSHVLDLFKVMVVNSVGNDNLKYIDYGFVVDFTPTPKQLVVLLEKYKPLPLTTLFSVKEREEADILHLISKQILHYIEVYGLNSPGLFNLEVTEGKVLTLSFIKGVSKEELGEMVRTLLYVNAPIKDTAGLKAIIDHYRIEYDLNEVKNNEMRVLLFELGKNSFISGDDAVRYMCYVATDSALLIKSKKVIKSIKEKATAFSERFFQDHAWGLSKVFHRHKNIILAAKTLENRSIINQISRRAKINHEPIREPLTKRFIATAYAGKIGDYGVLEKIPLRDKFKYLNLLEYKKAGFNSDAFIIRNGKVHLEHNRPILSPGKLREIEYNILGSIQYDLRTLGYKKNILLDPNVDYGLPISRKQTFGQLPFGTIVTPVGGPRISSGIYWEDKWGAHDLDLSAMHLDGERVGWGQRSGYGHQEVIFSGDLTSARNGAMEFMTSYLSYYKIYALYVNIFSGQEGSECELVVGSQPEGKWIENPVIREKGPLLSKGNIIGFVREGRYVVYGGRMNSNSWSAGSKEAALVARGSVSHWTIGRLFMQLKIPYAIDKDEKIVYDHDLSYGSFSFDKLEKMFTVA